MSATGSHHPGSLVADVLPDVVSSSSRFRAVYAAGGTTLVIAAVHSAVAGVCYLPVPMASRKALTKTQLRAIREGLIDERAALLGQVAELDAEADVKNWREGGFDDDPADAGSASFERETAQSLSNHARGLLQQIDDALRRMDAGTFGVCERCGKQIDRDRLEALPYAPLCLDCKRRDETGR